MLLPQFLLSSTIVLAAAAAAPAPAPAAATPGPATAPSADMAEDLAQEDLVELSLVAEHTALRAGETNYIAARFKMQPGWHIYWKGLNDTGFAPSLDLTMPAGFTVGEIQWPAPKRYTSAGGILDYVYEKDVLLIIPIQVPGAAAANPAESVTIRLESRWLVCKDACIPGDGAAELTIPVAAQGTKAEAGKHADLFAQMRARLARPIADSRGTVRARAAGGVLEIEAPGAEAIAYFPAQDSTGLKSALEEGAVKSEKLTARLDNPAPGAPVEGVIEVRLPGRKPAYYALKIKAD